MKKLISCLLSISTLCSAAAGITAKAEMPAVTPAFEIIASDTADLNNVTQTASDSTMYVNYWGSGSTNNNSYGYIKFDLSDTDLSKITSAKLAVYSQEIETNRGGDIIISDVGTEWDNTSSYGNPEYAPIAEITKINTSSTSGIFPVGQYSSIDITDYIRTYDSSEIGIGIASSYASVLTLSGVNSENPPKLIIQPGRQVDLTYVSDGEPCADMEVTIEPVGETEYKPSKFTTDESGKITAYLTEGTYRAARAISRSAQRFLMTDITCISERAAPAMYRQRSVSTIPSRRGSIYRSHTPSRHRQMTAAGTEAKETRTP